MNLKPLQNLHNTPIGKLLYWIEMFRGYSPVSPRLVELLLTYKCNLSCEFCYQAREKRETFPDMKIEGAKVIEENIRKSFYFKPRIHLFGGEPSVNRDFMKILRYFSNKGYKVSLTTNGVDIDKFIQGLAMTRNLWRRVLPIKLFYCRSNSTPFQQHSPQSRLATLDNLSSEPLTSLPNPDMICGLAVHLLGIISYLDRITVWPLLS